jgi:hypothetical protein
MIQQVMIGGASPSSPPPPVSVEVPPATVTLLEFATRSSLSVPLAISPTDFGIRMDFLKNPEVQKYKFPTLPIVPPPVSSPPLAFPVIGFTSSILRHAQHMALLTGTNSGGGVEGDLSTLPEKNTQIKTFITTSNSNSLGQATNFPTLASLTRPIPPPPLVSEKILTTSTENSLALASGNLRVPGKYVSYSFDVLKNPDEAVHFMVDVRNGVVLTYTVDMYILIRLMGSLTCVFCYTCTLYYFLIFFFYFC